MKDFKWYRPTYRYPKVKPGSMVVVGKKPAKKEKEKKEKTRTSTGKILRELHGSGNELVDGCCTSYTIVIISSFDS